MEWEFLVVTLERGDPPDFGGIEGIYGPITDHKAEGWEVESINWEPETIVMRFKRPIPENPS